MMQRMLRSESTWTRWTETWHWCYSWRYDCDPPQMHRCGGFGERRGELPGCAWWNDWQQSLTTRLRKRRKNPCHPCSWKRCLHEEGRLGWRMRGIDHSWTKHPCHRCDLMARAGQDHHWIVLVADVVADGNAVLAVVVVAAVGYVAAAVFVVEVTFAVVDAFDIVDSTDGSYSHHCCCCYSRLLECHLPKESGWPYSSRPAPSNCSNHYERMSVQK